MENRSDYFKFFVVGVETSDEYFAEWVEIPAEAGDFVVKKDHFPVASMIKNEVAIWFKDEKEVKKIKCASGGLFFWNGVEARIVLNPSFD